MVPLKELREVAVAASARERATGRPKRQANAVFGEVRAMNGVVDEPRAVVVPKMVIRVVGIKPDAQPIRRARFVKM